MTECDGVWEQVAGDRSGRGAGVWENDVVYRKG